MSGAEIHLAQGAIAGEIAATSVILHARLTASAVPVDGDVPGARGVGRFEIATAESFQGSRRTPWIDALPERDYILQAAVTGLRPGTQYYYRVVYGRDRVESNVGPVGRFKTLPAPGDAAPVNFIVISCMNYSHFHQGHRDTPGYQGDDRHLGYPALDPVRRLQPDFCILDGDCVYYDHPVGSRAQTQAELRRKWHEQHVQQRFQRLFARVPTYWLKDDHDYRINDSDTTGSYEPSHGLGIATFREQVPIVPPSDAAAVTYRTHRMGRHLQLWFVEGRDYRSPNAMPDGPEKSLWGAVQKEWLQRTLKESDATFKVLISPTPMVGPDDAYKRDNHVNEEGFRHEGEAFFEWLKANGIAPGSFYILCGDRHWKYHSVHPTGYEELSAGALNRENARLGRAPGDAKSTDPRAIVRQPYTDASPRGGFLRVAVEPPTARRAARIEFTHHDDAGEVLYRYVRPE